MKKIFIILSLVLFFGAYAYAFEVSVGPTYHNTGLAGKVYTDGREVNLTKDLGLDRADSPGFNLRVDNKKHHFNFDYAYADFTSERTLEKDITFHHKTFVLATHINSTFKYDLFKLQYYYDLVDIGKEDFEFFLSPLAGVGVYNVHMSVRGLGTSESINSFLPVPSLGLNAQLNITKYFSIIYQVNGMVYSNNSFLEGKAYLRVKPVKFVNLDVGYDYSKFDFHGSSDLYNIQTQGLYLQAELVLSF